MNLSAGLSLLLHFAEWPAAAAERRKILLLGERERGGIQKKLGHFFSLPPPRQISGPSLSSLFPPPPSILALPLLPLLACATCDVPPYWI